MSEEKSFGLIKVLDYILINFIIMLKILKEYKVNMLTGIGQKLIEQIIFLLGFLYVISISFGDLIGWPYSDFLLFGLFISLVDDISGFIVWRQGIHRQIQTGKINQYLVRPIQPILGYYFTDLNSQALISVIIDIIVIFLISFYFNIYYYNILISLLVLILIILLRITLHSLNNCIAFFSLGLTTTFYQIRMSFNEITAIYPYKFFDNFFAKWLFYGFAFFFVGGLLIPLLRNYEIWNPTEQILLILLVNLFFLIGTLVGWHYGLKKYEAFG